LLAKTGTVPAGSALATSGWAIVLDPSGLSASLAFLARGTGGDAAAALGTLLAAERPGAPRRSVAPSPSARGPREFPASVRVRLFSGLGAPLVRARNRGAAPARREGPRA